jgi:hypothetical protein
MWCSKFYFTFIDIFLNTGNLGIIVNYLDTFLNIMNIYLIKEINKAINIVG